MKNIFLAILFITSSCNQIRQHPENESRQKDSFNVGPENIAVVTTSLPVEPLERLPSPFVLDSIFIEDAGFNFTALIYFPKSNEDEELNKSMKQILHHEMSLEKPENKTNNQTSFEMWVTHLTTSGNLTCILFRKQTFTEGAAHYNHEYFTFNYDIAKKKRVLFTDVFTFSKSNSKQSFCNKLNGYTNGTDASDGYNNGLTTKELTKDLNYAILDRQLIVYPNYCCARESKTFTIDIQSVNDYMEKSSLVIPNKQ